LRNEKKTTRPSQTFRLNNNAPSEGYSQKQKSNYANSEIGHEFAGQAVASTGLPQCRPYGFFFTLKFIVIKYPSSFSVLLQ